MLEHSKTPKLKVNVFGKNQKPMAQVRSSSSCSELFIKQIKGKWILGFESEHQLHLWCFTSSLGC